MIIEMMMAKDARDRYQNAAQLIEDLEAVMAGSDPVHARPSGEFMSSLAGTTPTSHGDAPIPVLENSGKGLPWLAIGLGVLLLGSLLLNLVQALR
jgi:hypothetical protein